MTLEMLVSSALMGFTMEEQTKILKSIETGSTLQSKRLQEGAEKVTEVFDAWEPTVEGYGGFPIEREAIQKKKAEFKDDRNIGRVVQAGGNSFVVTGKKSDGRYIVVGKKGEKTAKAPEDMGLVARESLDIEDLHQMMIEKKMDGVDDNGFTSCWKGYKKRGTKMKGGKEVNNCVKEDTIEEGIVDKVKSIFKGKKKEEPAKPESRGEQLRKKYNVGPEKSDTSAKRQILDRSRARAERDEKEYGGSRYSKSVADKSKAAHDRYLKAGYSKYGAGDARGKGNKARKRAEALKKEELEFLNRLSESGLFTEAEIERIMEGME